MKFMRKWKFNDGGRAAAGFVGGVSDCVTRALAIHTGRPYDQIRREVLALAPDAETAGVNVFGPEFDEYVRVRLELVYIPMRYAFLVADFPPTCTFTALTSNHVTHIKRGVVHDVFDTGNELARGYWVDNRERFIVVDRAGESLCKNGPLNLAQAIKMRDMMYLNYKRKTWII